MTVVELLGAALATGLVGGLHCAAMCGPLAIAGCPDARAGAGYLVGRLVSYATLGAAFGWLARCAGHVGTFPHLQTATLALIAAAAAWRGMTLLRPRRHVVRLGRPRSPLLRWLGQVIPRRGLGLGLATGLLPCGMLMAAWMLAAVSGGPLRGAAVMAVFALATAPGLVAPILAARIAQRVGWRPPPRVTGAAWCALALWLALRPMLHTH